jgi:hypothetical protein
MLRIPRLEPLESRSLLATFVVLNTNDSGTGSLRQAILDANATTATDTINFNIATASKVINLTSELPAITNRVTINGASQVNLGDPPIIELNGAAAGTTANGLTLTADNNTIRGLVIYGFGGRGILIQSDNNVIEGNFIGTNVAGTAAQANLSHGIEILDGSNNRIGGVMGTCTPPFNCQFPFVRNVISGNILDGILINATATNTASGNQILGNYIGANASGSGAIPNGRHGINFAAGAANTLVGGSATGQENVLSGNTNAGVAFTAATAVNNVVQGNYIGTNPTGTASVPNVRGVLMQSAGVNFIGATAPGTRNVISGNILFGIDITDTASVIEGNLIGTAASGTAALPNGSDGIRITGSVGVRIGGTATGAGNTIAFNGGDGVTIIGVAAARHTIRANSIHSNGGLGIDLGNDGVTLNDLLDPDVGPNTLQNFPVINTASSTSTSSSISGTFNSTASANFTLDFYFSPSADPSGHGEGRTYLGSQIVTTNNVGDAPFNVTFSTAMPAGSVVTATATDSLGNTSEFSLARAIGASGNSPPTDIVLTGSVVPENANTTNPVPVGQLTAVDPDAGNTHTFQLVAGAGSTDNGFFQISGNRLEFRAGTVLDFETKPLYQVRISATDQGGLSIQETFIINVLNVNDAPTLAAIPDPSPILEDSGQQTVNLSGISAGAGESQPITVTATSSNPALIPAIAVNYVSPNTTGSLSYTPAANQFGTAVITVTVRDNGGATGGGIDTVTRSFTVSVTPVNDAPTLDPIASPVTIPEDTPSPSITLTSLTAGPGETTQTLSFFASSSNPALISNLVAAHTTATTGTLSFTVAPNQSGSANITLTVRDNGGTANSGADAVTQTFTISVAPVNDAPTLDFIPSPTIPEDALQQTVNLTGISGGPNESQGVTISATSSDQSLIPNPTVNYSPGNTVGSLLYTPAANRSGTAQITVTVRDNGGTSSGGTDTFRRTFTVTVLAANDAPTLDPIPNPPAVLEDRPPFTVPLSGITSGAGESQSLTVTATSSDPTLVPNPTVSYTSPSATGSLSIAPAANRAGTATITVTVRDNGGMANGGNDTFTRTFNVSVTPINDPPTLDVIPSPPPIPVGAGSQSINLTGISAGTAESQVLTVTATSSNPALIPDPTVTYTSPSSTGSISYQPLAGQSGVALITVTVTDDGGTANGGINTISRSFCASVRAGTENVSPCFATGPNVTAADEDGPQSIPGWATAITPGAADESGQTLTFELTALNPGLFTTQPAIDASGRLTFTPAPNVEGSTVVIAVLSDNGGTAGGGADTSPEQQFRITITKPHRWYNTRNPLDVNNSGGAMAVTAIDALVIFNALAGSSGNLPVPPGASIGQPFFYDTNRDNFVSAIDALRVLNFLNAQSTSGPGPEGESVSGQIQADAYFHQLGSDHANLGDLISLLTDDITSASARKRRI